MFQTERERALLPAPVELSEPDTRVVPELSECQAGADVCAYVGIAVELSLGIIVGEEAAEAGVHSEEPMAT